MIKVITYGTYDLLHYGHINLLKQAKALGDFLVVGITSDQYDKERGKLNVTQSLIERIDAVRATGLADQIIVEEYVGQKVDDIKKRNIDIFAIGSDWEGKFDYLSEYCKVVYLPRTMGVSSTQLRTERNNMIRFGIIGVDSPIEKFIDECKYINGLEISKIFDEDHLAAQALSQKYEIDCCNTMGELLQEVDAVYINTSIEKHYDCIMQALNQDCHVLCKGPMFLSTRDADMAFGFAKQKKKLLFEGVKCIYFPAFQHLILLLNSGLIGSIKDISVSGSVIREYKKDNIKYQGSLYGWGATLLSPIIKILGTDYRSVQLFDYEKDHFSYLSHGLLKYDNAIASFKAGKNIKVEGDLVIIGTKGYIYVPAPWWKPEYFEIRYEDLRENKKYFYKYEGEGLRYMITEFMKLIHAGVLENPFFKRAELLSVTKVIERFDTGEVEKL